MTRQLGNLVRIRNHAPRRWWLFVALCGSASTAFGQCEQAVGRLESSEGTVAIEQAGNWQPLAIGACVPAGVRVQVSGGRSVFRLANETLLRASGTTLLRFSAPEEKNWIHLFDGVLHFITRTPHAFDVQTDYVNAGVKGTEFILAANRAEQYGEVLVVEGEVLASNERGQQSVHGGAAVIAHAGQAPQLLTIPAMRNAVQWTLYYPPLPAAASQPRLQPVFERFYRSDTAGAIQQLEALPSTERNADYYALGAAIDLHRGEAVRARNELDQALALQPDHPQALALSAVSAIATGDAERAASLLDRAQTKAPRATAVLIARSYLEQARFQLPAAWASAREAAAVDPDDALIQARVAELALMNGDTKQASIAANTASKQQPDLARAHAIGGFIRLQQLKFDAAEASFKRAIQLDGADPLPRLGLGLIDIRHNRVKEGREQLSLAVALDPGQSLLRSYLGKAYQEEGRERLAGDQYALAKTLDNADPTPWLYSALLARAQNQPFDALDDLNRSIALNDNRAVYRSRLQLDADEAARTASQAEIYRELGFDQLAQHTAARAVSTAPSEYGGHRQLAEAYADDPQYDAARASEVLQAQLLQPLSATPLLPLLGETNLLATEGAGPSALGFREYKAMFVREKPWLSVSALGGSNQTGADEISLSGIYDRFAYALSQYHYETLGHRDNNDARYDVLSAYTKFQATEDLSFLLQVSRKEEDRGNINETLLEQQMDSFIQVKDKTNSILLGSHFTLSPGIDVLTALDYRETEITAKNARQVLDIPLIVNSSDEEQHFRTSNAELQGQFRSILPGYLVTGAGWAETKINDALLDEFLVSGIPVQSNETSSNGTVDHYQSGYAYWTVEPTGQLEVTAGVAYSELDIDSFSKKISGWYPKLSVIYRLNPSIDIRAAYFQSLKRPLDIEQTLEPTQLGGFNQFADEFAGIESDQYGLGFDVDAGNGHRFGAEAIFRDSNIPLSNGGSLFQYDAEQRRAQFFWNWSSKPWALSLTYQYEKSEYVDSTIVLIPTPLTTQSVPLRIQWMPTDNLAISTIATYFDQAGEFDQGTTKRKETFTLLNIGVNYSFWRGRAEMELRCNNVFDKSFSYENTNLYDTTPRISPFIPERTFVAGLKLTY